MEKRAIIDVGSNSVRIMHSGGRKQVITTKLGEGLAQTGCLQSQPMARTLSAIRQLWSSAKEQGESVEAFATEAVRSAKNGAEFVRAVQEIGIPMRVLTGAEEALSGYMGATGANGGAVMDVGGASTEIVFGTGGEVDFSVSLPIGIVRARDGFGADYEGLFAHVKGLLEGAKVQVKAKEVTGIGGTVICSAVIDSGKPYDRANTHGRVLTKEVLSAMQKRLSALSVEERMGVAGMDPRRADTVCHGLTIILAVMEHLGARCVVASEADNLEGYRMLIESGRI